MGCTLSESIPTRPTTKPTSPINHRARLRAFVSRLLLLIKGRRQPHPVTVKTYQELALHVPVEEPHLARCLCEEEADEEIERYEWAIAEMSLTRGERMRRESAPGDSWCVQGGQWV